MGQRLILRKRIVSKGKYIGQLATKTGGGIISIVLMLVVLTLFLIGAIMILFVCAGGGGLCMDVAGVCFQGVLEDSREHTSRCSPDPRQHCQSSRY